MLFFDRAMYVCYSIVSCRNETANILDRLAMGNVRSTDSQISFRSKQQTNKYVDSPADWPYHHHWSPQDNALLRSSTES